MNRLTRRVTGTNAGDTIDMSYVDGDGDQIDNGDALLPGEGPDDDILGGQGMTSPVAMMATMISSGTRGTTPSLVRKAMATSLAVKARMCCPAAKVRTPSILARTTISIWVLGAMIRTLSPTLAKMTALTAVTGAMTSTCSI